MPVLDVSSLLQEAATFALQESDHREPDLYGVTDGKAVGTYIEQKFRNCLADKYTFHLGQSASGIDFPQLEIDVKTTSIRQPQSSCPFKSARQKIYGLGYGLLIFVYEKSDDHFERTARLDIKHAIFVNAAQTADYQTTRGIRDLLKRDGNRDDLIAYFQERNLPVDDVQANELADDVLRDPPSQGYLTISNALQWRLQYSRVIQRANHVKGVHKLR